MRRTILAGLVLAVFVAVPAGPAAAADNTFAGSCEKIEGSAKFDAPLTATEADNGYHFTGTGICSGTLNGAPITDAPMAAQVDGTFFGSCRGSESTAPGPGKLVFTKGTPATADDVTVTFTMTFTGVASEIDFELAGTKGGTATGHASFLTTRTSPAIVVNCETDGNSELPFDASSDEGSLTSAGEPAPTTTTGPGQVGQTTPGGGTGTASGGGGAGAVQPFGIDVAAQKLSAVLRSGLRTRCTAACAVKVRLSKKLARKYKLNGVIASGSGNGEVTARLTSAARRKLRKARSVALIVSATAAGQTATRTVTLRR